MSARRISTSEESDAEPQQAPVSSEDEEPKASSRKASSGSDSDAPKTKRRARAAKSNAQVIESGSSSDSDAEAYQPETSKKRGSKSEPKKKKILNSSDEEGNVGNVDEFDDDMILDEEDRERLNKMSEKEREEEIFKRIERRELLKAREEIKQKLTHKPSDADDDKKRKKSKEKKLKKTKIDEDSDADESDEDRVAKKSKVADSDEDDVDMAYHRPSEVAKKHTTKNALVELKNRRKEKRDADEKRKAEAQRAALDIDDVFGLDGGDDDAKSSSSSSSSRGSRSRSSSASSGRSRTASPEQKREVNSVADLKRIRLSRFKLSQWCHYPFFSKLVIGCFVRIQIGNNPTNQQPIYRVAKILDVVETPKIYQLEKTRTNKGLKLQHGADIRVFRMMYVSNSEFTEQEYIKWVENMKKSQNVIPNIDAVERKEKEIQAALKYKLTESDIDYMVKEKARFKSDPVNAATHKAELQKRKLEAEQSGNIEEAARLQSEIDDLDQKTGEVDRKRTARIQSIAWINQKNRERMKQAFIEQASQANASFMDKTDDPFTRKSGKMRVVAGVSKIKDELTDPTKANMHKSASTPNFGSTVVKKEIKREIEDDMKSAHDIDLELDLKLPVPMKLDLPEQSSSQRVSSSQNPSNGNGGGGPKKMTLEDWKRRKGLI